VGEVGDVAVAGKFGEDFGDVVEEHVESAVEVKDVEDAAAAAGLGAEEGELACFAAVGLAWAVVEPAVVGLEVRMGLANPISLVTL
jgi:hypothetical protein